jgi:tRNA(fMet)-specific endonuclease VapC
MRLLDSDTCIHIMRGNDKVLQRLYECDATDLRFSVATLFELFGGIVLSKPEHLAAKERKLSEFRRLIQLAEFGPEEAYEAAKIKAELKGQLIGPYDLLIAATARVHGWTLATSNSREFSRVSNLKIEDWNSRS